MCVPLSCKLTDFTLMKSNEAGQSGVPRLPSALIAMHVREDHADSHTSTQAFGKTKVMR